MTVDVYVKAIDERFIEDMDEIKEDTMVEIFLVHPRDINSLKDAKKTAAQMNGLFYCAPVSLKQSCDEKCLAYYLDDVSLLDESDSKALFINAENITKELQQRLIQGKHKGVILNASRLYDELCDFYVAVGPSNIDASNIDAFDMAVLANINMDKIVLQSAYPEHEFEEIFQSVKLLSGTLFRPEESIIARATLHSLKLFGLK